MAARPTDHHAPRPAETEAIDIRDLPPLRDASETIVMSVSPTNAEHRGIAAAEKDCDQKIFLTPRVVDHRSFSDLTTMLSGLIEEANNAASRLQSRVKSPQAPGQEPDRASARLQERLRLGARMLKAFQGQINRVENSIGELRLRKQEAEAVGERLDEALMSFDTSVEELTAGSGKRVNTLVDEALHRFDVDLEDRRQSLEELASPIDEAIQSFRGRLREIADSEVAELERNVEARRGELERLDERAGQATRQVDSLLKLVELAEQKTAALVHRHAASICSIESRTAEANEIIHQCDDAKRILGETLLEAAERIDQIDIRCEEICQSTDRNMTLSQEAAKELIQRLAEAGPLTEKLGQSNGAVMELRELLERLEPWKKFLLASERTSDGTPRPVASMIESLHTGLAEDLASLSLVMRGLADRVDRAIPLPDAPERTGVIEVTKPAKLIAYPNLGDEDQKQDHPDHLDGEDADADEARYSQSTPVISRAPESSSSISAASEPTAATSEIESGL